MELYRLKDIWEIYMKRGGSLDKKTFKLEVQTFLRNAFNTILEGKELQIGYHIGSFKIARFARTYSTPVINWGESNKYKQKLIDEGKPLYNNETGEGNEWLVYFTDGYFYGMHWKKEKIKDIGYKAILSNVHFYQLKPYARSKRKLSASINEMSPVIFDLENK